MAHPAGVIHESKLDMGGRRKTRNCLMPAYMLVVVVCRAAYV